MRTQLPLNIGWRDGSSFENFHAPGSNIEALERLKAVARGARPATVIYLAGAAGAGKSHLLQALCRAASMRGALAAYVPLCEAERLAPALLEGLEAAIVCVDDVHAVAGRRAWETALFTLIDRVREAGGAFVAAGRAGPGALGLVMPELVSRLASGLVYRIVALSDAEKRAALVARARSRGLELSEEVLRYLLTRGPRDTQALFALLERIDRAALAEQRPVTIPFVRALLRGDGDDRR